MIFTNGLILGSYDGDGMNHGKKRNAVFWGIGEVVGARRRSCMKRKRKTMDTASAVSCCYCFF